MKRATNKAIGELAAWLKGADDIAILPHISPDGDTLGSSLAMLAALRRIGKRCAVALEDEVPSMYAFLPGAESIVKPTEFPFLPAYVLCVDAADMGRLGSAARLLAGARGFACIDHHQTNAGFGAPCVIDEDAAATGELAFHLIARLGVKLDREIATCLYTALVTDSGNFAFDCTTVDTFRAAAKCVATGINFSKINYLLFRAKSAARTKLLGMALSGIEYFDGGRIALLRITQAMLEESGAEASDIDRIVNYGIDTQGVEIAILAEERGPKTKLSLRSGAVNVAQVAQSLGGGGHERAAGVTLDMPLPQAVDRILAAFNGDS